MQGTEFMKELNDTFLPVGTNSEAVKALTRAAQTLRGSQDEAAIWRLLGTLYSNLNDTEKAAEAFRNALDAAPADDVQLAMDIPPVAEAEAIYEPVFTPQNGEAATAAAPEVTPEAVSAETESAPEANDPQPALAEPSIESQPEAAAVKTENVSVMNIEEAVALLSNDAVQVLGVIVAEESETRVVAIVIDPAPGTAVVEDAAEADAESTAEVAIVEPVAEGVAESTPQAEEQTTAEIVTTEAATDVSEVATIEPVAESTPQVEEKVVTEVVSTEAIAEVAEPAAEVATSEPVAEGVAESAPQAEEQTTAEAVTTEAIAETAEVATTETVSEVVAESAPQVEEQVTTEAIAEVAESTTEGATIETVEELVAESAPQVEAQVTAEAVTTETITEVAESTTEAATIETVAEIIAESAPLVEEQATAEAVTPEAIAEVATIETVTEVVAESTPQAEEQATAEAITTEVVAGATAPTTEVMTVEPVAEVVVESAPQAEEQAVTTETVVEVAEATTEVATIETVAEIVVESAPQVEEQATAEALTTETIAEVAESTTEVAAIEAVAEVGAESTPQVEEQATVETVTTEAVAEAAEPTTEAIAEFVEVAVEVATIETVAETVAESAVEEQITAEAATTEVVAEVVELTTEAVTTEVAAEVAAEPAIPAVDTNIFAAMLDQAAAHASEAPIVEAETSAPVDEAVAESFYPRGGFHELPIDAIGDNPHRFRTALEVDDLVASVREHGIIQPLVVATNGAPGKYTVISGERRLVAARQAGLTSVPAIIRQVSDREHLELAIMENLQRADLSPLELAEAYRQLVEDFEMSHQAIASRLGKSRASVSSTLRLLKLSDNAKHALADNTISEGHARVLLLLPFAVHQDSALEHILENNLSVKQTEMFVRKVLPDVSIDLVDVADNELRELPTESDDAPAATHEAVAETDPGASEAAESAPAAEAEAVAESAESVIETPDEEVQPIEFTPVMKSVWVPESAPIALTEMEPLASAPAEAPVMMQTFNGAPVQSATVDVDVAFAPAALTLEVAPEVVAQVAEAETTAAVETEAQAQDDIPEEMQKAILAYRHVTESNPTNDRAWNALGCFLKDVNRYEDALQAFQRALDLVPTKELYLYNMGLVCVSLHRLDEAIQSFEKLVTVNPNYTFAHCALAGCYRKIGNPERAEAHIRIAAPMMASEEDYNRACFEAICGNAEKAVELLTLCLRTNPVTLEWMKRDPDLDFIREDPRFIALVSEHAGKSK